MNISQVIDALPPLVYVRRGELVVQFATPADLVGRVAELSSVLTMLDQETSRAAEGKNRGARSGGRPAGNSSARAAGESDSTGDNAPDGLASDRQPTT